ncbi:hypothetical protein M5D96_013160 [Drosophila gunungcola]|uniref:Uncharacterized protein n=1 Tax=Drosophila gunungcola TaxID=103775 RepID=A0A9P9YBT8_9MUSC|nr:hypothetical protein M5D96_013160 [Drosophila gunungcola]
MESARTKADAVPEGPSGRLFDRPLILPRSDPGVSGGSPLSWPNNCVRRKLRRWSAIVVT